MAGCAKSRIEKRVVEGQNVCPVQPWCSASVLVTVNRECRRSRAAISRASSPQHPSESDAHLRFVREFPSADDVRREHPLFDRSFDFVAGPVELLAASDKLGAPYSVATDSTHRVFVADPDAGLCMSSISSNVWNEMRIDRIRRQAPRVF